MTDSPFTDYYELLQLSPNADQDTIQRVFRHLAKKYHPDHNSAANPERFRLLLQAHQTLSDPESRAEYDARYQEYWNHKWKLASEASDSGAFAEDREARERLLSLLYVQRRRSMASPGLGEYEIARLLRTPVELVDFHVWYLREKGWVARLDNGQLAISGPGVDQVERGKLRLHDDRLLSAEAGRSATGRRPAEPDAAGGEVIGTLEESTGS